MNNYNYGYDYYDTSAVNTAATGVAAGLGFLAVYMIFMLAIMVFMIVCMWKLFKKAGKNGWEAIIPIYNIIVMLEIAELPTWYIVLFLVPFANIYAIFKIYIEIAHKFGKSTGFGVAMVFFGIICLPILAFGSSTYKGASVGVNNMAVNYDAPSVQNTTPMVGQPVQTVEPVVAPVVEQPQMVNPMPTVEPAVQPINPEFVQPTVTPVVEQPVQDVQNVMAEASLPQMTEVIPFVEPTVTPVPVQPTQEVVNNEPTFINPEPVAPAVETKYCPHCGNQVNVTDTVCNRCNNSL